MEADTIVAIVTPPGEGGVGIVRASGPLAGHLSARLFPRLKGGWDSHRLRHGRIIDPATGQTIDQALGVLMRGPSSYTGEDIFEIQAHGSPLVLDRVVHACLAEGCRAARPGEFTLRAFLNGRLDLSQAEAVIDVVRARTNAGLDLAVQQLAGWLSGRIEPVRGDIMGTLAHIEAMVDFVEDDIPAELDETARVRLQTALRSVEALLDGAEQGIVVREGATLCIVGSPNAGKSSIMNGLLGLERSIVTPVPGTTRDTVEEALQVRGIPFRVVDTAGITDTMDVVERIGVERSRRSLQAADVVLFVLDRSRIPAEGDEEALAAIQESRGENRRPQQRLVVALNKSDLPPAPVSRSFADLEPFVVVESNTVRVDGLDALRDALELAALGGARHEYVVGNVRHQDALRGACQGLHAAIGGLERGIPLDLISLDVRAAAQALGEISGVTVDDELLDRIFRDFCIGK